MGSEKMDQLMQEICNHFDELECDTIQKILSLTDGRDEKTNIKRTLTPEEEEEVYKQVMQIISSSVSSVDSRANLSVSPKTYLSDDEYDDELIDDLIDNFDDYDDFLDR